MKRTGIFFFYQQGNRVRDFPQALAGILDKPAIFYYDALYESSKGMHQVKPVPTDLLTKVHAPEMIERIQQSGDYESAMYSAGGTVLASQRIQEGEIDNAFVFTSYGDHHAGKRSYGGGCYLNGAALAIAYLREKGMRRFAIIDTDAHHADGTRDIFKDDRNVLHICFCSMNHSDVNNNVDVYIPYRVTDEEYLLKVKQEFVPRTMRFHPDIIFWEFGYDATRGEYGDKGLSMACHPEIAGVVQGVADSVCHGRLVTILCGGYEREIATYTIPRIIARMAGIDTYC